MKNFGKNLKDLLCLTGLLSVVIAFATSCAMDSKQGEHDDKAAKPVDVPAEVSLKDDRSQYEGLRKEETEEIKKSNDELATVMKMMNDNETLEEPGRVRERFNTAITRRREKNDKNLRRIRDDFTKQERKNREDFLAKMKEERESTSRKSMKNDERKQAYDRMEDRKRDFFSEQNDKRRDFESDQTEARRTFEDYVREKTNQFNQLSREYTTRYYENEKNVALKKRTEEKRKEMAAEAAQARREAGDDQPGGAQAGEGAPPARARQQSADPLEDFRNAPRPPAIPLGVPDDGK